MSIASVMPTNWLILCHLLLLPSILPRIRVFFNKSTLHIGWTKYWSFSFSLSPSSEYSRLIFFFFAGKISLILKSQLQWYRKEWKGDPWKVVKPSSATRLFSKPGFATFISYAAAAARSLQSCLTLCNPIDDSPPGSPVPGILQARTLEWVAISFSNAWKWKVKVKSLSHVQFLVTPWTAAYQAPPFMGVSRQEYWSGLPLPSPLSAMWSWQMTYSFFFLPQFLLS